MKRLNYYQVHKNKKPVKRKKTILERGITITYKLGSEFIQSPFPLFKKKYNSEEINKFIEAIVKDQKKQRYLNRIKK